MKRQLGLTLIDLLITFAIGATLIGLSLPPLGALLERQRAVAAHNVLLGSLQQARTAAIMQRRQVVVCPSTDGLYCAPGGVWETGWMSFVDNDADGQPGGADRILLHQAEGVDALLVRSSIHRPSVRFLASGRSAGSNLSIRICTQAGRPLQAIIINNGGRARRSTDAELPTLDDCR